MIMEEEQKVEEEEVTTEDYENTGEGEAEAETGSKDDGSSEPDLTTEEGRKAYEAQIRKDQDKRWKDRLKDSKKSSKESSSEEVDERYERLELKTEGITNKKEQDVVLDYAKWKGISATEAMTSTTVKAELAELRAKNLPAPSTRISSGKTDSYEYYAKNIKAGKLRLSDVQDASMRQRLMKGKIFN